MISAMNLGNLRYFKSLRNIFLFTKVFFSLLILKILICMVPIPKLLKLIDQDKKRDFDRATVENMALFADIILYRIFRTGKPCMLRSLLLLRSLRSMGEDVKIVFGVKDEEDVLKGHAWLLNRGRHFLENEDPSSDYEIIYSYP